MRVLGLDPALGGGNALVCAELGDNLTILDARIDKGLSKTEQIFEIIEVMATDYRPSMLIVEFDSQQKGIGNDDRLAAMGRKYGFSVRPHITRGQKMDAVFGVASMDQSFKQGLIRIPYGDKYSQDRMEPLIRQLKAWRPDVATKMLEQDGVMALWFIHKFWKQTMTKHQAPLQPAWRPSWLMGELPARRYN